MTPIFDPRLITEATLIVNGHRSQTYGHPKHNFQRIAAGWEQIFNTSISLEQVALAMIWLKVAREINQHKTDNLIDIIGYTLTLDAVRNNECDNNSSDGA